MIQEIDTDKYIEYYSLTDNERRKLKEINFWRAKNNLPLVDVPKSDELYWKTTKK